LVPSPAGLMTIFNGFTTLGVVPLSDYRIFSQFYIKIQFLPHRRHITSPLQRPDVSCCLGKKSMLLWEP
jgi:hypothetical protein